MLSGGEQTAARCADQRCAVISCVADVMTFVPDVLVRMLEEIAVQVLQSGYRLCSIGCTVS